MKRRLIKLIWNMRGATAVEYGLIVALIVIVAVVGIQALGSSSANIWGNIANKASDVMPNG